MKVKKVLFFLRTISILVLVVACSRGTEEKKEHNGNATRVATDSTFIFKSFHLAIDAPRNWKSYELDNNVGFLMDRDTERVFCPNIVARFVPLDEEITTLDQAGDLFIRAYRSRYKNFDPFSVLDKEIDGIKMIVIDYKMLDNGTNLGGTTAIILLDDKKQMLTLSMMAENVDGGYLKYRLLFESVLNTRRTTM
jgi:hypothetical protein